MAEKAYSIVGVEKRRLLAGLAAAFAVPIIDDVEDYVWEAVFHYVKGIRLADPIIEGRTKQLFDAVAPDGRGWSLKTLVCPNQQIGHSFEFVIQRADIFKKAVDLGFAKGLHAKSAPNHLGRALIRHWNAKFQKDSEEQGVTDPRVCILLKDLRRRNFTYAEFAYPSLKEENYTWRWSRADGLGLKGFRRDQIRFKWYHGQKQLFEVIQIPKEAYRFQLDWNRATLKDFVSGSIKILPR
jgi:hypothetical protein